MYAILRKRPGPPAAAPGRHAGHGGHARPKARGPGRRPGGDVAMCAAAAWVGLGQAADGAADGPSPADGRSFRAVLLVSSLSSSWDVRCGQRDALAELVTRRIEVEEVDGALPANRERRDELCAISGRTGLYPQLFRALAGGGSGSGHTRAVEYVGAGTDELRWLAEASSVEGGGGGPSLELYFGCSTSEQLQQTGLPSGVSEEAVVTVAGGGAHAVGVPSSGPRGTEGSAAWLRRRAAAYTSGLALGNVPTAGAGSANTAPPAVYGTSYTGRQHAAPAAPVGAQSLQSLCVAAALASLINHRDIFAVLEVGYLIDDRTLLVPALAYFRKVLPLLLEQTGGDDTQLKAVLAPSDWQAMEVELAERREAVDRLAYARAGRVLEHEQPPPRGTPPQPPTAAAAAAAGPGQAQAGAAGGSGAGQQPTALCAQSSSSDSQCQWVVRRRCLVRRNSLLDSPIVDPPLEIGQQVLVDCVASVGGRARLRLAGQSSRGTTGWVSEVDGKGRQLLALVDAVDAESQPRWNVRICADVSGTYRVKLAQGSGGDKPPVPDHKHPQPVAAVLPERKAAMLALRDRRLLSVLLPYPPEFAANAAVRCPAGRFGPHWTHTTMCFLPLNCVVSACVLHGPASWQAAVLGLKPAAVCNAVTHARNNFDDRRGPAQKLGYFVLHKPAGCVCQRSPVEPSCYDRLPAGFPAVPAVGRLDRDTEGLLLFTEDSRLGHALIAGAGDADTAGGGSGSGGGGAGGGGSAGGDDEACSAGGRAGSKCTKVTKVYHVQVDGLFAGSPQAQLKLLREPIRIDGKMTRPAAAKLLGGGWDTNKCWLEMSINEGRNRQIRRCVAP
eukprot:SAG22_NODE_1202_length_5181_cov_23.099370_3_plen_839_part_00